MSWGCRALREELYRAYLTRASAGDIDNTPIISEVVPCIMLHRRGCMS